MNLYNKKYHAFNTNLGAILTQYLIWIQYFKRFAVFLDNLP